MDSCWERLVGEGGRAWQWFCDGQHQHCGWKASSTLQPVWRRQTEGLLIMRLYVIFHVSAELFSILPNGFHIETTASLFSSALSDITALFHNRINYFFPSTFYTQHPIMKKSFFFVLHFFPNVSKKQIKLRNHMKRSIQSLGFVLCKCIYSLNSFRKGSCQLGTLWTVWPLSSQHHQAGRGQSAFSDYLWRCLWGVLAGPLQDLHSVPEATALMPRPKDQLPAQSEVQSSLSSRMSLAVSPWPLEFCKT